jgi:hypothetical protein
MLLPFLLADLDILGDLLVGAGAETTTGEPSSICEAVGESSRGAELCWCIC